MRRALAVLIAAFALAACRVDTTVDVSVKPDGSGTITVTAIADAELVTKTPGLADDLRFDDAKAAGWQVDGPTKTDAGGLRVVVSHTFASVEEATALLKSLNGTGGPLHDVRLTRVAGGHRVTTALSGKLSIVNGLDAFADPDVLAAIGGSPYANDLAASKLKPADVMTFTFVAGLPGTAVTSGTDAASSPGSTPTADSTSTPIQSFRWTVPLDGTAIDVGSTSVLDASSSSSVWGTVATAALIGLVVWTVLAVGFILFVAKARRDRALRQPLE